MAINNSGEVVGGNGGAFTVVNGQLQSLANPAGHRLERGLRG